MESIYDYSNYLQRAVRLVDNEQVNKLISILYDAYSNHKTVFIIGNGGSAANASHFAQDLAKGTRISTEDSKRIMALSLTDNTSFICAVGNDDGYDRIFEQQLQTYAKAGDVLIAISGSGNSPNIIKAVNWANNNQITTIGLTGFNGGKLNQINKYSVHVPLDDMGGAESIHAIIFHYVITVLKKKLRVSVSHGAIP